MFVLFLTLYATAYSGNSLLGYPGEAYRRGFSWVMSRGLHDVHHRLPSTCWSCRSSARWRSAGGFVTPGDWVRHRFEDERGAGLLL